MARLFIVVGDRLSSGGGVITGSPFTDVDGRPMARVGDRTFCPAHGPGTIISGDATLIVDGNPAARHGDWASCGCQLIAAQQNRVSVDRGVSLADKTHTPRREASSQPGTATQPAPAPSTEPSRFGRRRSAGAVCWADDHSIRVSANAHGRYYQVYGPGDAARNFRFERRFTIAIPLRSSGDVEVTVRLKIAPQESTQPATVTEAEVAALKARMEAGIEQYWNEKFGLVVTDPSCGELTFPIRYKVAWVSSGQDYTMNIAAASMRENVASLEMNVWKDTNDWTLAHEYAHCVGIADEYAYADEDWTLRYYASDGTLDEAVIQLPAIKPASDPTATIMSTSGAATTESRHAWPIALEAQASLTRAIGRAITCAIS